MIRTQAGTFELVEEHRGGWNPEIFKERYSDILDKYDYIVGDWGYGQLRLRGFYDNVNRKVPFEQKIASLDEYLHEFCNFGCAYFVLRRLASSTDGERKPAAVSQEKHPNGAEAESSHQEQQSNRPQGQQRSNGRGDRGRHYRSRSERGDKVSRSSRHGRHQDRKDSGQDGSKPRQSSPKSNGQPQREQVMTGGSVKKDPQG
ncbi:DUF1027 domain-containing protein [Brevibacillus humidisoli]|uniref:YutD family protein n=1 Tax=Brevibacillus humidisoli TaxID=2895522 RepID=UPI001E4CB9F4|nr:YutD family protein [Brevibacillus humidisoli]UFJ39686.1 DUF1027 domain-containing protein [Brevibacillus humidisoli]